MRGKGNLVWVLRERASPAPDVDLWDRWIQGSEGRVLAATGGRAPVYKVESDRIGVMVLRGFHHGGFFARLLGSRFLGVNRFLGELSVSEAIRRKGVPTPEVLALHFRRRAWGTYEGWILTRYVPDGRNLRQWVEAGLPGASERRKVLTLVARTVSSLHAAGCLHSDLNLSNLLLAQGEVLVLDLDGAVVQFPLGIHGRCNNLLRLYRSLAKVMDRVEPLSVDDRWVFVKEYAGGNREFSRVLWRQLSLRWALARTRSRLKRGLRSWTREASR